MPSGSRSRPRSSTRRERAAAGRRQPAPRPEVQAADPDRPTLLERRDDVAAQHVRHWRGGRHFRGRPGNEGVALPRDHPPLQEVGRRQAPVHELVAAHGAPGVGALGPAGHEQAGPGEQGGRDREALRRAPALPHGPR